LYVLSPEITKLFCKHGFKKSIILKIKIANRWIGDQSPVFLVAEGGINHNGNIKIAKKLVEKAQKCGADAIKFQTFKAIDLASVSSNYFKLFKKLELKNEEFAELSDFAKSHGIIFFSTPFSIEAVDLLVKLKIPAFKIASGDLTNIPLIKYASSKKKPIIISTGMSNLSEIKNAINAVHSMGNKKIIIMHSVSSYPTIPEEVNLKAMLTIQSKFHYPTGYSDNGNELLVPIIAAALGANIIEKHFTLNRKYKGPDHKLSADPKQFTELANKIRLIKQIVGDGIKRCQPSELKNKTNTRRSIITETAIPKGSKIKQEMIGIKRPAIGIEPKFIGKILGKTILKKIKAGEPLQWKYIN